MIRSTDPDIIRWFLILSQVYSNHPYDVGSRISGYNWRQRFILGSTLMKRASLSVVMPNYNHAHYLPTALQAILDQSYQPDEIIVVDDASTDNSLEILETFAHRESRLRIIRHEQNKGVIDTLNELLQLTSGDYFYSGAADDYILPGFLDRSMQLLTQFPQVALSTSPTRPIDSDARPSGVSYPPPMDKPESFFAPEQVLFLFRRYGSWIAGNTTIYKRQMLIDPRGYIKGLEGYADSFIAEVLALRYGLCFIPEPLGVWRRLETSYSGSATKDLPHMVQLVQYADQLRKSTYTDAFPPDYAVLAFKRG